MIPGHGSMVEPPSRGVMHFYGFPGNPPNYNWMEGFCGGKSHQWGVNGGKYDLALGWISVTPVLLLGVASVETPGMRR